MLPASLDTVFLDRDGTINVKAPEGEYVEWPEDVVLLPGAAAAVRRLNEAGLRVVLITNQRWLARPGLDPGAYAEVHARLEKLLAADGARIDASYHCPHASGSCACRKPLPGMLLDAAADLGIDLARSVMVGDAASDVAAGRAAGTATIRLGTPDPAADAVVPDLAAAVELLLSR